MKIRNVFTTAISGIVIASFAGGCNNVGSTTSKVVSPANEVVIEPGDVATPLVASGSATVTDVLVSDENNKSIDDLGVLGPDYQALISCAEKIAGSDNVMFYAQHAAEMWSFDLNYGEKSILLVRDNATDDTAIQFLGAQYAGGEVVEGDKAQGDKGQSQESLTALRFSCTADKHVEKPEQDQTKDDDKDQDQTTKEPKEEPKEEPKVESRTIFVTLMIAQEKGKQDQSQEEKKDDKDQDKDQDQDKDDQDQGQQRG